MRGKRLTKLQPKSKKGKLMNEGKGIFTAIVLVLIGVLLFALGIFFEYAPKIDRILRYSDSLFYLTPVEVQEDTSTVMFDK